jgi:uncharacterized protein with HEPN domain
VGNVYRHEYDVVDDAMVWHTIQNELEPLRKVSVYELHQLEERSP